MQAPDMVDDELADLLARADQLDRAGRLGEAVDVLTAANRHHRREVVDQRLVALRHRLARQVVGGTAATAWPPSLPDPFGADTEVPEVPAHELTGAVLGGALLHHGSLLVRGLLADPVVERLRDGIDRALDSLAAASEEPGRSPAPWFVPFDPPDGSLAPGDRLWALRSGTVYAGDAPALFFDLVEAMVAVGLVDTIGAYLGERPVISLVKTAVRRLPPDAQGGWHQDGQFLGTDLRVVNSWIPLSDCGAEAPGLDFVPRRLDSIVPTGTDGAPFEWCVGQGMVDRVAGSTPVVRPDFRAGDALLFDDFLLHRTGEGPGLTKPRYGIESWFFAPSGAPDRWVPLAV